MSADTTTTKKPGNFLHDSHNPIEAILRRIQQPTIAVFGDFGVDVFSNLEDTASDYVANYLATQGEE